MSMHEGTSHRYEKISHDHSNSHLSHSNTRRSSKPYRPSSGPLQQTPYVPFSERKKFNIRKDIEGSSDSEPGDEIFEGYNFCGKRWALFSVSPLMNFETREVQLKNYGFRLRESLKQILNISSEYSLDAKFSVLQNVDEDQPDNSALEVRVAVSSNQNKEKDSKDIYVGVFLSVGVARDFSPKDCTNFPLLLSRANVKETRAVHLILNRLFDCAIYDLAFSQEDISWLMVIISCLIPTERKSKLKVSLTFKFSFAVNPGHTFFHISLRDLKKYVDRIHADDSDELLQEEVKLIFKGLCNHLSRIGNIDVNRGRLIRFSIPGVIDLNTNGIVRIHDKRIVQNVLTFFTELVPELGSVTPSLSPGPESIFN